MNNELDENIMNVLSKVGSIAQEYLNLYAEQDDRMGIEFEQFNAPEFTPDDNFKFMKNDVEQFSVNQLGEVKFSVDKVTHSDIVGIAMISDAVIQGNLIGQLDNKKTEE